MKEFKCSACKDARVLLKAEPTMVKACLARYLDIDGALEFKTLDAAQQVCGLKQMLSSDLCKLSASKGRMPKNDGREKSEVTISNLEVVVVISFFEDAELRVAELNWKC
jgi:hypothetical protein